MEIFYNFVHYEVSPNVDTNIVFENDDLYLSYLGVKASKKEIELIFERDNKIKKINIILDNLDYISFFNILDNDRIQIVVKGREYMLDTRFLFMYHNKFGVFNSMNSNNEIIPVGIWKVTIE